MTASQGQHDTYFHLVKFESTDGHTFWLPIGSIAYIQCDDEDNWEVGSVDGCSWSVVADDIHTVAKDILTWTVATATAGPDDLVAKAIESLRKGAQTS